MMQKEIDVTALGELLIDFTENGVSSQGNALLEANPGGAPCNVLAMLGKLGKKTAFIGKVGNDQFGNMLRNTIESVGIDAEGLVIDDKVHTTLAFVHTYPDGDRDFSFYRNPGADMMLKKKRRGFFGKDMCIQNLSFWNVILYSCGNQDSFTICNSVCKRSWSVDFL